MICPVAPCHPLWANKLNAMTNHEAIKNIHRYILKRFSLIKTSRRIFSERSEKIVQELFYKSG